MSRVRRPMSRLSQHATVSFHNFIQTQQKTYIPVGFHKNTQHIVHPPAPHHPTATKYLSGSGWMSCILYLRLSQHATTYVCISMYIYIYIEREREITYLSLYIYIYILLLVVVLVLSLLHI